MNPLRTASPISTPPSEKQGPVPVAGPTGPARDIARLGPPQRLRSAGAAAPGTIGRSALPGFVAIACSVWVGACGGVGQRTEPQQTGRSCGADSTTGAESVDGEMNATPAEPSFEGSPGTVVSGGDADEECGSDDDALADYRDGLEQLESELNEAVALSSAATCERARSLKERICELATRICDIADRHPDDDDVSDKCRDGQDRCTNAGRRIVDRCTTN